MTYGTMQLYIPLSLLTLCPLYDSTSTKGRNYIDRDKARQEIFKYIKLYYNPKRLHSKLGYTSPYNYKCKAFRKDLTFYPV